MKNLYRKIFGVSTVMKFFNKNEYMKRNEVLKALIKYFSSNELKILDGKIPGGNYLRKHYTGVTLSYLRDYVTPGCNINDLVDIIKKCFYNEKLIDVVWCPHLEDYVFEKKGSTDHYKIKHKKKNYGMRTEEAFLQNINYYTNEPK